MTDESLTTILPPPKPAWEKIFPVLTFILAILCLFMLGTICYLLFLDTNETPSIQEVCKTKQCNAMSKSIERNMNLEMNPCVDFEEFACGGYRKWRKFDAKSIAYEELNSFNDFNSQLQENLFEMLYFNTTITYETDPDLNKLYYFARALFKSCLLYRQSFFTTTKPENPWPVSVKFLSTIYDAMTNELPANITIEAFLAVQLARGFNSNIFEFAADFQMTYDRFLNKSLVDIIVNTGRNSKKPLRKMETVQFIENLISYIPKLKTELKIQENIDEMLQFYNKLIIILKKENLLKSGYPKTFSELKSQLLNVGFKLDDFIDAYIGDKTKLSSTIIFKCDQYQEFMTLLSFMSQINTKPKVTSGKFKPEVSMLLLTQIMTLAEFFPVDLMTAAKNMTTDQNNINLGGFMSEKCYILTTSSLSPIISDMYSKVYLNFNFNLVYDLIKEVQKAGLQLVDEQDWISHNGKTIIKNKFNNMKASVGFQQLDKDHLVDYFQNLTNFDADSITSDKDNFGKLLAIAKAVETKRNQHLLMFLDPISIFYLQSPFEVNAFNYQEFNWIVFPISILTSTLFSPFSPAYLNYGGLGWLIGHEIGHSFDTVGHHQNFTRTDLPIWDNQTEFAFIERRQCIEFFYANMDLYTGMKYPEYNAKSSTDNNICDLVGLSMAFRALQNVLKKEELQILPGILSQFTIEQMFYIQAAQMHCTKTTRDGLDRGYANPDEPTTHSPGHLRILASMTNNPQFADVFQCKPSDPMLAKNKCHFW